MKYQRQNIETEKGGKTFRIVLFRAAHRETVKEVLKSGLEEFRPAYKAIKDFNRAQRMGYQP